MKMCRVFGCPSPASILLLLSFLHQRQAQQNNAEREAETEMEEKSKEPPCRNQRKVCAALLWMSGTVINQDPSPPNKPEDRLYCSCAKNSPDKPSYKCDRKTWENDDGLNHINFYHHERVDWKVQFKFCKPIAQKKKHCSDETSEGAIISTPFKKWDPSLKDLSCVCRTGTFFMRGWHAQLDSEGKNPTDWNYTFICGRQQCKPKEPCNRHYVDRSALHTVGYKFLCSCRKGFRCPLGVSPIKSYEVEKEDIIGPFVHGYCEAIPGWREGDIANN